MFHSFILLDEVDLFSNRTAANARDISKRYIARSKPYLVIISTPNVPDGLDYSLHGRATERQAIYVIIGLAVIVGIAYFLSKK